MNKKEHCDLFCGKIYYGPCLADDCPRRRPELINLKQLDELIELHKPKPTDIPNGLLEQTFHCLIELKEKRQMVTTYESALRGDMGIIFPDGYEVNVAKLKYDLAQVKDLVKHFKDLICDVQQWCDAVERDSSWDSWDHHYKSLKWTGLPHYRKQLPSD